MTDKKPMFLNIPGKKPMFLNIPGKKHMFLSINDNSSSTISPQPSTTSSQSSTTSSEQKYRFPLSLNTTPSTTPSEQKNRFSLSLNTPSTTSSNKKNPFSFLHLNTNSSSEISFEQPNRNNSLSVKNKPNSIGIRNVMQGNFDVLQKNMSYPEFVTYLKKYSKNSNPAKLFTKFKREELKMGIAPVILNNKLFMKIYLFRDNKASPYTFSLHKFYKEVYYQTKAHRTTDTDSTLNTGETLIIPEIIQYGTIEPNDKLKDYLRELMGLPESNNENIKMAYIVMDNVEQYEGEPLNDKNLVKSIDTKLQSHGIFHNDLSTYGNVFYNEKDNKVIVIDFGEADYKKDMYRNPFKGGLVSNRNNRSAKKRTNYTKRNKNNKKSRRQKKY